jgi:MscS family membrane protein
MDNLFQLEVAGNQLWRIIALFGVILIALLLGRIARFFLEKFGGKVEAQERDIAAITLKAFGKGVVFLFASVGIVLALPILELKAKMANVANTISAMLLTIGVGYFLYWLAEIPGALLASARKEKESKLDAMILPILRKSLRISIVILVLVQIAQILSDKPITSIIAGLGIGGLAIALAAQDSLKNFFGSFVIFADKPFEVGDRVVIDGHDGPIEDVGLRSTKIRTLDGHLITVPNGELANKTIQNIGKRPYIRRLLNLTITYDTPPEKIDRAIEILKGLLDNHEGMQENFPPRVYFNDFNAASLNILVIYWYHPPHYWDYMSFTERFNKEVFHRFSEEGIDFAFPTQTLFLAGDSKRPLILRSSTETKGESTA